LPLVSVFNDPDSHGGGELNASTNPGKFFINGKKLVTRLSSAKSDSIHDGLGVAGGSAAGESTAATSAATASTKFFAFGKGVHRKDDLRFCNAKTIVVGQSKFFSG
jgi:hypothetical protein